MRPRLARTLAVLALLFLAAGLVSTPGARTDGRTTAADIASRAIVHPSLSGTRAAAAKSAGRAVTPLLRRMLPGTPGPEWLGVRVHALPSSVATNRRASVGNTAAPINRASRTHSATAVVTTPSTQPRTSTMRASTSSIPSSKPKSTATSSPAPSTPVTDATSTNTPDWNCIAAHESGGSYTIGGAEPYGGKYQFSLETWRALGFPGVPNTSPPWMQDQAALALYHWDLIHTYSPWSAWETAPMCGL